MAPVADRTRFRLKFTKKYAPLEHFGSGLVYHADMSDAKNSEGGEDLDFDIFSAPIPETLPTTASGVQPPQTWPMPSWPRWYATIQPSVAGIVSGTPGRARSSSQTSSRSRRRPRRTQLTSATSRLPGGPGRIALRGGLMHGDDFDDLRARGAMSRVLAPYVAEIRRDYAELRRRVDSLSAD